MKQLELVRQGNTNTLLTVTQSRITIKFKDGLSNDEETRIQNFLTKVAAELYDVPMSMRGSLQDTWKITMRTDNRKISRTFFEADFTNQEQAQG